MVDLTRREGCEYVEVCAFKNRESGEMKPLLVLEYNTPSPFILRQTCSRGYVLIVLPNWGALP